MIFKNLFLISVFVLIAFSVQAEVRYFNLRPGKMMAYEWLKNSEAMPTLILLPGVNRSLSGSDRSVKYLAAQGFNLLLPSLPAHPLSIHGLDKNISPYFLLDGQIRSNEFARDIESLVGYLEIKKAIPVTLSYSSSVGIFMNQSRFSFMIESVPMVDPLEGDAKAAQSTNEWEKWLKLNPMVATFWIRQFRDAAYYSHWGKIVDSNLQRDPHYYGESPRVSDIKFGYVTIARASEEFNLKNWNFHQDHRTHDFILAERENPERLQNQRIVIQNYLSAGKAVRVVVIGNAGHILPTERPEVYAEVLSLLSRQIHKGGVQFARVDSLDDISNLKWQGADALKKWIQSD
jgi:pimeloyl-ACP methyl ester carboxylesterase